MLLGLQALHKKNVLHRDLKPANLLISTENVLQITDFGLAVMNPPPTKPMTREVITIWYRPPELLLGSNKYGTEVDMWSAGCILYEMITKNVLFRASMDSDIEELKTIFMVAGLPTKQWPEWTNFAASKLFLECGDSRYEGKSLENFLKLTIPREFEDAIDLLLNVLNFNPQKRFNVDQALEHPFFNADDGFLDPEKLPKLEFPDSHQSIMNHCSVLEKKDVSKVKRPIMVHLE